jgi:hypothetical protein
MSKYQKPIRNVWQEMFDVEWPYEKNEQVRQAYEDFWKTLNEETALTLDMMLL